MKHEITAFLTDEQYKIFHEVASKLERSDNEALYEAIKEWTISRTRDIATIEQIWKARKKKR